jgi:plasmid stabilization system protein ParE
MAEIIWSKLALLDLENIYDFIARDSPFYAQKTAESLLISVELLSTFPELGRNVPEYSKKNIREIIEGNYRIFYLYTKKNIFIIRVHHAARKIKKQKLTI